MEVIKERLEREYGIPLIVTAPSVKYTIQDKEGKEMEIRYANALPQDYSGPIKEPFANVEILVPEDYVGNCMELATQRRGVYKDTQYLARERVALRYEMPLAEIIRDFFDELKSRSRGYASMDYGILSEPRLGDLVKLYFTINDEECEPLAQIVHRSRATDLGGKALAILYDAIPQQQFRIRLRAHAKPPNKILHSKYIQPVRKDVTAKCYGGDITRKKKLLMKQARGKKLMESRGLNKVNVPTDAFVKVIMNS
jgi:GTP-binding protein LepA